MKKMVSRNKVKVVVSSEIASYAADSAFFANEKFLQEQEELDEILRYEQSDEYKQELEDMRREERDYYCYEYGRGYDYPDDDFMEMESEIDPWDYLDYEPRVSRVNSIQDPDAGMSLGDLLAKSLERA